MYRNLPLCGLERVDSFEDLENVAGFDPTDVENLKKVYHNVRDVDLFTGGESGVIIHVSRFTCKFIAKKCGGDKNIGLILLNILQYKAYELKARTQSF